MPDPVALSIEAMEPGRVAYVRTRRGVRRWQIRLVSRSREPHNRGRHYVVGHDRKGWCHAAWADQVIRVESVTKALANRRVLKAIETAPRARRKQPLVEHKQSERHERSDDKNHQPAKSHGRKLMSEEMAPKHSTEHLTDEVEALRQTLVWLIETQVEEPQVPCSTCGHDIFDHTDEEAHEGACGFPRGRSVTWADDVSYPAPNAVLCRCQRFSAAPPT